MCIVLDAHTFFVQYFFVICFFFISCATLSLLTSAASLSLLTSAASLSLLISVAYKFLYITISLISKYSNFIMFTLPPIVHNSQYLKSFTHSTFSKPLYITFLILANTSLSLSLSSLSLYYLCTFPPICNASTYST